MMQQVLGNFIYVIILVSKVFENVGFHKDLSSKEYSFLDCLGLKLGSFFSNSIVIKSFNSLIGEENEEDIDDYSTVPVVSVSIPLRHTIQQNNWDCGISCVAMVLPENKITYFNEYKEDIITEEGIEFKYV